jgi:hypothetical protein
MFPPSVVLCVTLFLVFQSCLPCFFREVCAVDVLGVVFFMFLLLLELFLEFPCVRLMLPLSASTLQLANPGELQVRDVVTGGIFAIQIYGCFKLGEISVRRNIAGYEVPAPSADTFKKF